MSLIREFTGWQLRPFQGGVKVLNPDGTAQNLASTYQMDLYRHGETTAFLSGTVAGGQLTVNAAAGTIDFLFAAAGMTNVVGYGSAEILDMGIAGGRVMTVIPVRFLPQGTPSQPEYNERLVLHANSTVVVVEPVDAGGAIVAESDYGDITVSGLGLVWTIDANVVSNSKLADMAAGTVKGNITGTAADPADVPRAGLVPWLDLQAAEIEVTPSGNLIATTVAAALSELDAEKLALAGGTISGDLIVTGTITHNGPSLLVNATTVTYDDIILVIGGDTAPVADDGKDRGVEFRWHDGAAARLGFFGFDRSTQEFLFVPDATDTADVISGTAGTFKGNLNGNATSSSIWATGRTITLTGMVTGVSAAFNGSANLSFATALGSFTLAQLNAAISDGDVPATTHTHLLAAGATDVTVTAANLNALDDGADTALHFHAADRARANHTGTQLAATISDFAASVIATVLTGFAVAGARTTVVAADSILAAFGKVQKYLNDLSALAFSGSAADLSGTKTAAFISDFAAAADARVAAGIATHEAAGDPHPQYLTPAEGNSAYSVLGHTHSGLAPTGGAAGQVLKKIDATDYNYSWQAESGGGSGITDGDYGDITVSGGGTILSIDPGVVATAKIADANVTTAKLADDAVTYAKLQDVAANSVVARVGAAAGDASAVALAASQILGRGQTGDVAAISLGAGLSMSGTSIVATPDTGAMVFIAQVTGVDTTTVSVTNIAEFSAILLQVKAVASATTRSVRVALSDDNGVGYGAARTIYSGGAALAVGGGTAHISATNQSATNKVITPAMAVLSDADATGAIATYTTVATETVETGIINALQFSGNNASIQYTVLIMGIR